MIKVPSLVSKFSSQSKGTLVTKYDLAAADAVLAAAIAAAAIAAEAARAQTAEGGLAEDIAAEAEARDEAIAAAKIGGQTWLPSVATKSALPSPSSLDPDTNYLCRVTSDATAANNGVWQLVAGAEAWSYFSGDADYVTQTALASAVAAEATRAQAAESGLAGNIAAEATRALAAEASLQEAIDDADPFADSTWVDLEGQSA
jgi:hypothetical protein